MKSTKILGFLVAGCVATGALAQGQIEPKAGTWKTWIIPSGSELRLPPPPDRGATEAETAWLKNFTASADANARNQVAFWDTGSPAMRWIELVSERVRDGRVAVPAGWRQLT
jgi:hypothetical protein